MRPIRPKKSLGQNFLSNSFYEERIVDALNIQSEDVFLEIGPGKGVMTSWLVRLARHVIAVELDDRLIEYLEGRFEMDENFELLHGDILDLEFAELEQKRLRIFGNIPYHITSGILFHIFDQLYAEGPAISDLHILMQKEVAERIVAPAGSRTYGLLSVFSGLYALTEIMLKVPPTAFQPAPKVDSALVRFSFYPEPAFQVEDLPLFSSIVRTAFHQRRKKIRNSLGTDPQWRYWLNDLELDLNKRPEQMELSEFVNLYRQIRMLSSRNQPTEGADHA